MPRTNVRFLVCLTLICWTAAVVPASAQHFLQIPGSLSYIAAGRSEVWGLQFPGGLIWRFNPSSLSFYQVSGSLSQIAVGGGTLLQPDQVWGVNGAGVFSFNLSTNAYTQHNPPGAATFFNQVAVGEGDLDSCHPYEVWGLASSLPAYSGLPYRYNYCEGQFVQVPLPSGSTIPFTHIATAPRGSDVWALDADARIWHLTPCACAWTEVYGGYGNTLQQITVGINDVWGIDGNGTVYRYDPYLGYFVLIQPGRTSCCLDVTQIAAGADGVWTILAGDDSDYIQYFNSGVHGFWYIQLSNSPGKQIAVGSGAGVWLIDTSNRIYTLVL